MALLLEIILPVFGLVVLGYVAAWRRIFSAAARDGLTAFAFSFAIPAMLFRSIAQTELPDHPDWHFIATYYLAAFAVFLVGFALSRFGFRRDTATAGVFGFTGCYSNFTLLGIPLLLTAFGDSVSLPMFLLLAFHSLLLTPLVMITGEIGRGQWDRLHEVPLVILRGVATNPIFMGLAAGLLWNLLNIPIPAAADSILRSLAQAAVPCALFAMGATLAQYGLVGRLTEAASVTVLKTFLHPLLVWFLARSVFTVDPEWQALAIVIAALPVGVTPYLMAARYQAGAETATSALLLSTVLSTFTVSILLFLLQVR